jgi:Na+/proline symporter
VASYFGARSPNALRRNSILLPWYQLLLFIPMMVGATALFVTPALKNSDLALFTLVTKALPSPLVAIIGVAGALSAIVPMSVFVLAIGTLWGRTLLGGGNGADPRRSSGGVGDARTKALSQVVCFLAGLVALAGSLFYPSALVQLSVLSYEGLAQLVPVVLLALFWRRMSTAGAVAGLLTGTAIMLALWLADHDPLYGVNAGVIGLVANLIVNACVSYARPDVRVRVAVAEEAS